MGGGNPKECLPSAASEQYQQQQQTQGKAKHTLWLADDGQGGTRTFEGVGGEGGGWGNRHASVQVVCSNKMLYAVFCVLWLSLVCNVCAGDCSLSVRGGL